MKNKPRTRLFLTALLVYVLLQFLWWEILLVRQTAQIIEEKQKILALSVSDKLKLETELKELQQKQKIKTFMIVGEGTVFLLLLVFGVYKVKQAQNREEELSRQQNNFFLSITHELKTPIAATKLQLQTIQKQKPPAELQDQLIRNALFETERLNALIDNVLLASRMDSPGFRVQTQKANASELLPHILQRYYSKQLQEGKLILDAENGLFTNLDEQAFTSIVTNLVSNALKYSPEQDAVKISLKSINGICFLNVADKGPGISKNEKEKIFEKFYRAGNEETRRHQGTGLGLYIVKKLVDAQGWHLSLKSGMEQGAVFEIEMRHA